MTRKKLNHYKKLILDYERELLEGLNERAEDIGQLQDLFSMDWADRVSADNAMNFLMALESDDTHELREVFQALRKIDEGTYGICESCGREISDERLEAVPLTRFCLSCQSQEEKKREVVPEIKGPNTIPKEVFEWYES